MTTFDIPLSYGGVDITLKVNAASEENADKLAQAFVKDHLTPRYSYIQGNLKVFDTTPYTFFMDDGSSDHNLLAEYRISMSSEDAKKLIKLLDGINQEILAIGGTKKETKGLLFLPFKRLFYDFRKVFYSFKNGLAALKKLYIEFKRIKDQTIDDSDEVKADDEDQPYSNKVLYTALFRLNLPLLLIALVSWFIGGSNLIVLLFSIIFGFIIIASNIAIIRAHKRFSNG